MTVHPISSGGAPRSTSQPIPLLLISDAPSSSTGLGRITADLATRIHRHLADVYRVGVLGYGGPGSRNFGFQQYAIEGMNDWIIPGLPEVWKDFAGDEWGISMPIWDLSRLLWYAQPARCEMLAGRKPLREWLVKAPFERWGYFPIDADGPNRKLSFPLHQALLGFNRIIAYGAWSAGVVARTLALDQEPDHLPHGIDTSVFYPRNSIECRFRFGSITGARSLTSGPQLSSVMAGETLIGIVATNQTRKDWALGIEAAALLGKTHRIRLWVHTDALERYWSIPALLVDYGLLDRTVISVGFLSDDDMAKAYSACNLTFGIGAEGFGYPLAESLACGTPVIHGNYAGGAELVPEEMRVEPLAFRKEGLYCSVRPVYDPAAWAACAERFLSRRASLDPQYAWQNLWPRWEAWFREGRTSRH
jgi:glycosyltransferase involved in cell wall biosynthesis